jgi:hypothetical protein
MQTAENVFQKVWVLTSFLSGILLALGVMTSFAGEISLPVVVLTHLIILICLSVVYASWAEDSSLRSLLGYFLTTLANIFAAGLVIGMLFEIQLRNLGIIAIIFFFSGFSLWGISWLNMRYISRRVVVIFTFLLTAISVTMTITEGIRSISLVPVCGAVLFFWCSVFLCEIKGVRDSRTNI